MKFQYAIEVLENKRFEIQERWRMGYVEKNDPFTYDRIKELDSVIKLLKKENNE